MKTLKLVLSFAFLLSCNALHAALFEATAITQVNAFVDHNDSDSDASLATALSPIPADLYSATFNRATSEATAGTGGLEGVTWARAGSNGSSYARSITRATYDGLVISKSSGALPDSVMAIFEVDVNFSKDNAQTDSGSCGSGNKLCVNFTGNPSTIILGNAVSATYSSILNLQVGVAFDLFVSADMTSVARRSRTLDQSFTVNASPELLILPDGYSLNVSPVPLPAAVWLFGTAVVGLFGAARFRSRQT